jgi:hypothetical protein
MSLFNRRFLEIQSSTWMCLGGPYVLFILLSIFISIYKFHGLHKTLTCSSAGEGIFAGSSQAQFQFISPVKFIWDAISSLRYREVLKKMTSFKDGILPSNNVFNLSMMGAGRDANANGLN